MYVYVVVRGASGFSETAAGADVAGFLEQRGSLVRRGPATFAACSGTPWMEVVLARADDEGNYVVTGGPLGDVNVVEIVTMEAHVQAASVLAGEIAGFLGWAVFEET